MQKAKKHPALGHFSGSGVDGALVAPRWPSDPELRAKRSNLLRDNLCRKRTGLDIIWNLENQVQKPQVFF